MGALKGGHCDCLVCLKFPGKRKMGQKWYQSTAYDLPISRLVLFLKFKEPWPFKFKETFLSGLINF
jgi:hypothetical protein